MKTDISAVTNPVEIANGLPNAHYVDAQVFAEERNAVLFANWSGLAVAADVPETGDAKPVEFLGIPLLILRGKDNVVRVFQNICRHRGMILVEEPKKIEGAIRCPYHSWCYAKSGKLVATPHVGGPGQNAHPGIDRATLGLQELRSHVWRDCVFINLSGTAAPFEEVHGDLLKRWAEFEQPLFHGGTDSIADMRSEDSGRRIRYVVIEEHRPKRRLRTNLNPVNEIAWREIHLEGVTEVVVAFIRRRVRIQRP